MPKEPMKRSKLAMASAILGVVGILVPYISFGAIILGTIAMIVTLLDKNLRKSFGYALIGIILGAYVQLGTIVLTQKASPVQPTFRTEPEPSPVTDEACDPSIDPVGCSSE